MSAMDLNGFDATNEKGLESFEPIPLKFVVGYISSTSRETSNAGHPYAKLEFTVTEPEEHKGRNLWANLNLGHESKAARERAKKELVSICRAVNVMQPPNTDALKDIPMVLELKIEPPRDGYDAKSAIKNYFPISDWTDLQRMNVTLEVPKGKAASSKTESATAERLAAPWEKK